MQAKASRAERGVGTDAVRKIEHISSSKLGVNGARKYLAGRRRYSC